MRRPDDRLDPVRRLSPAMLETLRWLPADGSERRCSDPASAVALRRLRDRGLSSYRANPRGTEAWRLTAAGRATRRGMEPLGG
jgi:hypothetical protein